MTCEKELSFTYGYIIENFSRLFNLIDRFNILSAAEDLVECNFSNLRKKTASRMMKNWTKDVSKYFESNIEKTITADNIKLQDHYNTAIKDFSKRLEDFNNADVKSYIDNIQTELLKYQDNSIVAQNLIKIKEAIIKKQEQVMDIQRQINEKFPEQSSTSKNDIRR